MDDKDTNSKELSTSALAKELKISTQSMFQRLLEEGFITKNEAVWDLTNAGKSKGGVYKHSDKYGRYIVWPASIIVELEDSHEGTGNNLLTATVIGKSLDIPANRINSILSELGWIKKDIVKGWQITELGKRLGGIQSKYKTTGIPFVRWPENIIKNKILTASVREAKGDISPVSQEQHQNMVSNTVEFRDKFKAEHRAQDGHYVRSKSELIIDNWLYVSKVVHAYERKLPIEEDLYCDFYIPTGKVYIEYWGLEEDKYIARKEKKLEIYKKYSLNLIQLTDKDVLNLEDTLPAKLLEFGIPVE
jgi:hypothetical protein